MARKQSYDRDEYEREPLVDINENSNVRRRSMNRKSLPTFPRDEWNMDRDRSSNTEALEVTPKVDFYIDCEDER